MNIFTKLPIPLQQALEKAHFSEPTPIQAEAIPKIIAGSDVLGIAQTGTGKTAAFVLPIIHNILVEPKKGIRALILCPTRELAVQVAAEVRTFTKGTNIKHVAVYGGVGQNPQVNALKQGVQILIATPGRLMDLYEQSHVPIKTVEFFVLDEADRMLDMGFIHDITKIAKLIPKSKQTLFFSATMSVPVKKLADTILNKPVHVEVAREATPVEKIEQKVMFVDHENKVDLLLHLLQGKHLEKVIIFTKTKKGADRLCRVLKGNKISAQQIHGDRTQSQRTQALKNFTVGKSRCLIATDVAARGIDIDDISHVINYDLPTDAENYVHRIGRTARAGAEGTAYSFCTADDMPLLRAIHKSIGGQIECENHKYHSDKAQNSKIKVVPKRPKPRGGSFGGPRKSAARKFRNKKDFKGSKRSSEGVKHGRSGNKANSDRPKRSNGPKSFAQKKFGKRSFSNKRK